MKTVYIYVLTDPVSHEERYVGLTRYPKKRLENHCAKLGSYKSGTLHFRNWLASLEGLVPKMEIVHITNEEDASTLEKQWIIALRMTGCRLLNYTTGGERGYALSEETRRRIGDAHRGKKHGPLPDETKRKLSESLRGRNLHGPWTKEQRFAMSLRFKGKKPTDAQRKKAAEAARKAWTPELRKRMSEAHKGHQAYVQTIETRAKISDGVKRAMTPELRQRISESKKGRPSYVRSPETRAKNAEGRRRYFAALKGSKSGQVRAVNSSS